MASAMYNSGLVKLGDGSIDWNSDTIKIMAVTNSYTPNVDSDDFLNDVSANEASGSGYSTGGITLTCSVTQDNTNNRAIYDATDISVSALVLTWRYWVVYKSTGVASTSPLICYIDLTGSGNQSVNGVYDLTWNAGGVFNLTAA